MWAPVERPHSTEDMLFETINHWIKRQHRTSTEPQISFPIMQLIMFVLHSLPEKDLHFQKFQASRCKKSFKLKKKKVSLDRLDDTALTSSGLLFPFWKCLCKTSYNCFHRLNSIPHGKFPELYIQNCWIVPLSHLSCKKGQISSSYILPDVLTSAAFIFSYLTSWTELLFVLCWGKKQFEDITLGCCKSPPYFFPL